MELSPKPYPHGKGVRELASERIAAKSQPGRSRLGLRMNSFWLAWRGFFQGSPGEGSKQRASGSEECEGECISPP